MAKFIGDFLSVKTRLCCCSVNEQKNGICPHPIRTVHMLSKLDLLSACANTALGHATGGLSKCKFERFLLYKKWNSYTFNLARSELVVKRGSHPFGPPHKPTGCPMSVLFALAGGGRTADDFPKTLWGNTQKPNAQTWCASLILRNLFLNCMTQNRSELLYLRGHQRQRMLS